MALDSLLEFFRNPCRYLLRRRLGVDLPQGEDELQDEEPFLPDYSGRARLAARLLPAMMEDAAPEAVLALAAPATNTRRGAWAKFVLEREMQALRAFAAEVREAIAPPCLPPHHASWISTSTAKPGAGGRVRRPARDGPGAPALRRRAGHAITSSGWLQHLFLCAAAPTGVELETRWYSRTAATG